MTEKNISYELRVTTDLDVDSYGRIWEASMLNLTEVQRSLQEAKAYYKKHFLSSRIYKVTYEEVPSND